jgi:hypothetical protein
MNFEATLRDWSAFHAPDLKSSDSEREDFSFDCSRCRASITANLNERIQDWEMFPRHSFSAGEQEQIQRHYGMGPWSHSPCGGGIHFDLLRCPSCGSSFLFSYGIDEPNNGLLVLTVQGVVEVSSTEPGASPNGGPGRSLGNSGAGGGPPSVS